MKKLALSLCLLMVGSAAAHSEKLHDFLVQSETRSHYENLSTERQAALNAFWLDVENLCVGTKEEFAQLLEMHPEALEVLRELIPGADYVDIAVSLTATAQKASTEETSVVTEQ